MTTTKCPNKTQCGSCEYSEMPYQAQLDKKLLDINILLSNNGVICKTILPSPKTEHYRNKMDYVINFQRAVGLREKGKWWKVIDGHTCFIADESIENIFFKTRDWVKTTTLTCWDRKLYTGFLRFLVARVTTSGETLLTIVTSPPKDADEAIQAEKELLQLAEITGVSTLVWAINTTTSDVSFGTDLKTLKGSGSIVENINDIKYRVTPNSFFQTNSHSAKVLQDIVVDFATKSNAQKVLDLYCGCGFFALALAKAGKTTYGIELVEDAIKDAKENATLNGLTATFKAELAEKMSWLTDSYDLIVLDPTRAGLHPKVLEGLLTKQPENIIYVSCNYKQFATELPKLLTKYYVADCVALDQFPHTPHVELIAWLKKL